MNPYMEQVVDRQKLAATRDFDRAQALFKRNPIYNALGFLHQNARNEMKLGGYGLQYHQAPTPFTKLSKVPNAHNKSNEGTILHQSQRGHSSLEYHHARRKDIASNIQNKLAD